MCKYGEGSSEECGVTGDNEPSGYQALVDLTLKNLPELSRPSFLAAQHVDRHAKLKVWTKCLLIGAFVVVFGFYAANWIGPLLNALWNVLFEFRPIFNSICAISSFIGTMFAKGGKIVEVISSLNYGSEADGNSTSAGKKTKLSLICCSLFYVIFRALNDWNETGTTDWGKTVERSQYAFQKANELFVEESRNTNEVLLELLRDALKDEPKVSSEKESFKRGVAKLERVAFRHSLLSVGLLALFMQQFWGFEYTCIVLGFTIVIHQYFKK